MMAYIALGKEASPSRTVLGGKESEVAIVRRRYSQRTNLQSREYS